MSDWIRGDLRADCESGSAAVGGDPIRLAVAEVRGAARLDGPEGPGTLQQDEVAGHLVIDGVYHPVRLLDVRVGDVRRGGPAAAPEVRGTVWARVASADPPPEGDLNGFAAVLAELLLAAIGLGFVWLAAGPRGAAAWAAVLLATAVVRRRSRRSWPRALGVPLVAAQLALVLAVTHAVGVDPCGARPWWVAAALAAPVLAAGRLAVEPGGLSLLWTFGWVMWFTVPEDECLAGEPTSAAAVPIVRALERAGGELRARYGEWATADDDAALISEGTPRVTAQEALRDPAAFFSCGQRVVIGGDALFKPGRGALRPGAAASLRPLRRLVAQRPDKMLVIEAHVGPGPRPAALSEERAAAVSDWLGRAFPGERFVFGYGVEHPLVTDPDVAHLNRRVEVFVACR